MRLSFEAGHVKPVARGNVSIAGPYIKDRFASCDRYGDYQERYESTKVDVVTLLIGFAAEPVAFFVVIY